MKKLLIFLMLLTLTLSVQASVGDSKDQVKLLKKINNNLRHRLDVLEKKVDDNLWFQRLSDRAFIDKLYLYGPPLKSEKNPTAQGAGNPVKYWAYLFIPKDIDFSKKYPLIVFPHGGVHSNLSTYYTHIIRELMYQQYIVVAAEYRGSTGYGRSMYEKIDYGGLEVEDVDFSRKHIIDNYDFVDPERVGIMGWSHGGMISLHNIFRYPKNYKVAYAGVPVSDIIARMGYKTQSYRDLYSADYHIGKTAYENVNEYRRRSPAWQAHKLQKTPLLIYTNTNDADVNVLEVEHLIKSLKAEKKKFSYKIFQNVPGGHSFDRMDTKKARTIRLKIYEFLGKYLKPSRKLDTMKKLNRAAYLPVRK